jgi:diguanylate cyclase (GGDEF)-like protein
MAIAALSEGAQALIVAVTLLNAVIFYATLRARSGPRKTASVDRDRLREIERALRAATASMDGRQDVCEAALRVYEAESVQIWEPEGLDLVATGSAGTVPRQRRLAGARAHANEATLKRDLQRATGALYVEVEPIRRETETVGLLAVGWRRYHAETSDETRFLFGVLVAQAAIAIERARLIPALAEQARTDALTGLPNRRTLEHDLPLELARARRGGVPACLALLDLDYFKPFNDQHGHQAGDALLRQVAAAWRPAVRETDLLVRLGGDEFAVVLPDCDVPAAEVVLTRMRAAMPAGHSMSAGVAQWELGEPQESLIGRADHALYAAKAAGRGRTMVAPGSAQAQLPQ